MENIDYAASDLGEDRPQWKEVCCSRKNMSNEEALLNDMSQHSGNWCESIITVLSGWGARCPWIDLVAVKVVPVTLVGFLTSTLVVPTAVVVYIMLLLSFAKHNLVEKRIETVTAGQCQEFDFLCVSPVFCKLTVGSAALATYEPGGTVSAVGVVTQEKNKGLFDSSGVAFIQGGANQRIWLCSGVNEFVDVSTMLEIVVPEEGKPASSPVSFIESGTNSWRLPVGFLSSSTESSTTSVDVIVSSTGGLASSSPGNLGVGQEGLGPHLWSPHKAEGEWYFDEARMWIDPHDIWHGTIMYFNQPGVGVGVEFNVSKWRSDNNLGYSYTTVLPSSGAVSVSETGGAFFLTGVDTTQIAQGTLLLHASVFPVASASPSAVHTVTIPVPANSKSTACILTPISGPMDSGRAYLGARQNDWLTIYRLVLEAGPGTQLRQLYIPLGKSLPYSIPRVAVEEPVSGRLVWFENQTCAVIIDVATWSVQSFVVIPSYADLATADGQGSVYWIASETKEIVSLSWGSNGTPTISSTKAIPAKTLAIFDISLFVVIPTEPTQFLIGGTYPSSDDATFLIQHLPTGVSSIDPIAYLSVVDSEDDETRIPVPFLGLSRGGSTLTVRRVITVSKTSLFSAPSSSTGVFVSPSEAADFSSWPCVQQVFDHSPCVRINLALLTTTVNRSFPYSILTILANTAAFTSLVVTLLRFLVDILGARAHIILGRPS